jgi:Asp-tRNA(Asn)/Glu-tRNA(Gln) amidotransferase A subunit family amidase
MQQCFAAAREAVAKHEKSTLVDLGRDFVGLNEAADLVTEFETWQSLGHERLYHRENCSAAILEVLERGRRHTFESYVVAKKRFEAARLRFDGLFGEFDCIVTPSAPDEAPRGLHDTGPSTFNKMWTMLHVPCVNVPAGRGLSGLPLGLQVIAPRHRDDVALLGAEKLRAILETANG